MMNSKIAIITGGTSGVGLSISKALAQKKYSVYFIGSNNDTGKQLEEEMRRDGNKNIHFVRLDLSDLKAVFNFATDFVKKHERLDILLNIAGVIFPKKQETKNGFDKTFTIGYLSAFVLCNTLLPLLEKTEHSRILNVAGDAGFILKTKLNLDDLNFEKNYSGVKTAVATIHAKAVLTQLLSEKFKNKNVTVNSFHPGIVKSKLTRNMPFVLRILAKLAIPFMADISKTGIYLSTSDELVGVTGKFFVNKKAITLNFDASYQQRLWHETEKLVAMVLK